MIDVNKELENLEVIKEELESLGCNNIYIESEDRYGYTYKGVSYKWEQHL